MVFPVPGGPYKKKSKMKGNSQKNMWKITSLSNDLHALYSFLISDNVAQLTIIPQFIESQVVACIFQSTVGP